VQFVGSATIGTDHVDQNYLTSQGIDFHYAPGCNAQSVADWILSVLSRLHLDSDCHWWEKTIGIVGVGNVGASVAKQLKGFGCRLLLCDPPKRDQGLLSEHCELDQLLATADIICFHTPHTKDGQYPTNGLLNAENAELIRNKSVLINAGRGPVFEEACLFELVARNVQVVLDVWPSEPTVSNALLEQVALASPHVAGYSLEGKFKGTQMLADALFTKFSLAPEDAPPLPKGLILDASLYQQPDLRRWLSELILAVYDPARDTATMRVSVEGEQIHPNTFDALRKAYPTRRELSSVAVKQASDSLKPLLQQAGFQLERNAQNA
jgi:erythronate-4-phosphate dehydrogenase